MAVTLVVIGPVRGELERRITHLKVQAITQLEAIIGRQITYSSISPSILRYFAINDLTVHGLAGEPADLVTVQRLRIYYRPWDLLRGEITEAFSEIRVENTSLSIDTRRDSDLMAILSDIAGSREASGAGSLIPNELTLSGRNIELKIASELGILRVENLFFTATAQDDVLSIRSDGDVQLLATTANLGINEIEGRLLAVGSLDLGSGSALFDVTIPELRSDVASLERQVFQVSYDAEVVEARKIQDRNPVDLYLRFQPEPMELYARILSDGYRLSDLVHLEGEFSGYNTYLQSPVRGQASATITETGITYAGSLLTRASGLPIPDGDLTVRFSGDAERVTVDELDYRSEIGDIEFDGVVQFQPFRPEGRVSLRNFVYGGIAPLSVTGRVQSAGDTISVDTNRFTYAGVQITNVVGFVALSEKPFSEVTVTIGGGRERRLNVTTEHDASGAARRLTVDARSVLPIELRRLQQAVLPDLQLPDLDFLPDSLVVDTRLSADLADSLSVDVPLFYAVDMARPENNISFSLHYGDDRVEVRDATVSYDGYDGTGNFVAEFGRRGMIGFESDVIVEGIPYQFTGTYDPKNSLVIRGLHDVDAQFYFGARDEVIFSASGNIPLPIAEGVESRLAFDGNGYFFSETDWAVSVENIAATGVPYYAVPSADFSLAGDFDPNGGVFREFGYRDAHSALSGTGSVSWSLTDLTGRAELVLTDDLGVETYAGSVGYDGDMVSVSAVFTHLPLLRVGVSTVRGSVNGAIDIHGAPDALETRVAATLRDGRFNGDLVELSGVVNVDPLAISIDDVSGRYVRTRFEGVAGELSLENGTASLVGAVVQPNNTGEVKIGFNLTGEFGDEHTSFGQMLEADFAARAVVSGLPVRNDLPTDWQFALSRESGTLSIVGGPEDALVGVLESDGEFSLSLGSPVPLSFDAVGILRDGKIEADLTNVSADVAKLWRIVDSPGVNFLSGTGEGSVRIVGPLNDPDFYGTLIASNITGTVDLVADLIGPMRTYLVFDEKVLSIRETVAPAGPGRARVSAAVTLDRWLPDEFRVWVDTLEGGALRVVNDFGGVAVDGLAEASIVILGDPDSVRIEGSVIASAMHVTLSEVQESTDGPQPTGDLIVDLQVTTGRGVQFLWPTDAFPILRGFADGGETARITHRQSTGSYTVNGSVDILGGEVFYFDRSFYIKEGRMVFAEDQDEFDPLLTVNAEIREMGQDGPIRIYLVADERPLSQFTPMWRSDPPLPEAEIIALLGGNVFVTQDGDPINLSQAVLLTSDLVSQFGIIHGFETTIRDALQLDLFSIRTQLFQNLIRGVLDQTDYPLDSDVPSLGEYLNNTTLFLGKYLGTDLFLELLVQLRATDPVATPTRSLAGIVIDSELSLEWQTPFFLLEWSFFPRDPSSLFITDNTISFAWEYSY